MSEIDTLINEYLIPAPESKLDVLRTGLLTNPNLVFVEETNESEEMKRFGRYRFFGDWQRYIYFAVAPKQGLYDVNSLQNFLSQLKQGLEAGGLELAQREFSIKGSKSTTTSDGKKHGPFMYLGWLLLVELTGVERKTETHEVVLKHEQKALELIAANIEAVLVREDAIMVDESRGIIKINVLDDVENNFLERRIYVTLFPNEAIARALLEEAKAFEQEGHPYWVNYPIHFPVSDLKPYMPKQPGFLERVLTGRMLNRK